MSSIHLRRPIRFLLFCLVLLTGTSSCQSAPGSEPLSVLDDINPASPREEAQADASIPAFITATYTPFQASSPTARPTLTPTSTITPTLTPVPCTETRGRIEPLEVAFTPGADPYVFRVYTPPCYDPAGETRYPVIYMIHGQTYKDDQWDRLGMDEAADQMISDGKAPPFLMVMPLEQNTFADIFATSFGRELVDGLVPWIDANYATCAERTCRAIGGLSRGGAWALRLGFTRWDLFGSVGLHSTPPFIGDPNQFPYWLREIPADQVPRLYMDTGKSDYWIRPTTEFEALLVRQNVAHEWYLFNGAHDEAYWSAHVTDYLAWYTQSWKKSE